MRRRRRRWNSRPKFSSESATRAPSQLTGYEASVKFVRDAFFHLDDTAFSRFLDLYAAKHGERAKDYLITVFPKWKAGLTKMSARTERRILQCVPRVLNTKAQFQLLSFQVPAVISQQKQEFWTLAPAASSLKDTYERIARRIIDKPHTLDWFVKDVFPEEELNEFNALFRYTMVEQLRHSFVNVRKDLALLRQIIPKVDGKLSVSYSIDLLGCSVDIDRVPNARESDLDVSTPAPRLVTEFHSEYRTLLLEHALLLHRDESEHSMKNTLLIGDLNSVTEQLRRTAADQEYETTLRLQGGAGQFTLHIEKKSVRRLQCSLEREQVKLACFSAAVLILLYSLGWKHFWPVGPIVFIFGLSIFLDIWNNIKKLRNEITAYERQRSTRITTE